MAVQGIVYFISAGSTVGSELGSGSNYPSSIPGKSQGHNIKIVVLESNNFSNHQTFLPCLLDSNKCDHVICYIYPKHIKDETQCKHKCSI